MHHADAIWDLSRWHWPEESFYYGRDGVVRFNEHWLGQFNELDFEVVEVDEVAPGLVFVPVAARGLDPGSCIGPNASASGAREALAARPKQSRAASSAA